MMRGLLSIPKWFAVVFSCALASGFAALCRNAREPLHLAWLPTTLLVAVFLWASYERLYRRNEEGSWALLTSGSAATPSLWGCFALLVPGMGEIFRPTSDLMFYGAFMGGALMLGSIGLIAGTLAVSVMALRSSRRGQWLNASGPIILLLISSLIWFAILAQSLDKPF